MWIIALIKSDSKIFLHDLVLSRPQMELCIHNSLLVSPRTMSTFMSQNGNKEGKIASLCVLLAEPPIICQIIPPAGSLNGSQNLSAHFKTTTNTSIASFFIFSVPKSIPFLTPRGFVREICFHCRGFRPHNLDHMSSSLSPIILVFLHCAKFNK